ncbi:hypothetical protein EYF80_009653 [Liparis tanakae]|uniref:Uncharacterized protein n=1 Tax=Liparis tanakae TaxID=230148 RepID=A0A4Z2IQN7_9TELE|nr:hypothetical protein EYF80_009653 [Liparis tanakae]
MPAVLFKVSSIAASKRAQLAPPLAVIVPLTKEAGTRLLRHSCSLACSSRVQLPSAPRRVLRHVRSLKSLITELHDHVMSKEVQRHSHSHFPLHRKHFHWRPPSTNEGVDFSATALLLAGARHQLALHTLAYEAK